MQQPYELNPECNYRDMVPLERDDRRVLLISKVTLMVPLSILLLLVFVSLVMMYAQYGFNTFQWDMLLLFVIPMLFAVSVYNIVRRHEHKEIFESDADDTFGIFSLKRVYFRDTIGSLAPPPFYYGANRVKIGKRYKIHKLRHRDLILKIEDIV